MKNLKTTNILLLIIVIPLIFYLLKILSFIFIPLTFAMFIALMFLPLMRWLHKRKVPNFASIIIIILIITGILKLTGELIEISSAEIVSSEGAFLEKAQTKILGMVVSIESFFRLERLEGENIFIHYFKDNNMLKNFGSTLNFIGDLLTMVLMTVFFAILLLSGSIDFQKFMNKTMLKSNYSSIKTFIKIERDVIRFVKVKFFVSLLTGIGFGLACLFFGVSFPVFWGLFAFVINFIQMVGSVVAICFY